MLINFIFRDHLMNAQRALWTRSSGWEPIFKSDCNLIRGPYKRALIAVHHCGLRLPQFTSCRYPRAYILVDCGNRNPQAAAIHEPTFSWIAARVLRQQIFSKVAVISLSLFLHGKMKHNNTIKCE